MKFPSPKDHCFQMMSQIFGMLSEPNLCDLSVAVEDTLFRAHKCVLIAACPTLYDIVLKESENAHKNSLQLTLQGLSPQGFHALLLYIYTGIPPNVKDKNLMEDFVKSCCALGVPLSHIDKDAKEECMWEEDSTDENSEVIVEVTAIASDGDCSVKILEDGSHNRTSVIECRNIVVDKTPVNIEVIDVAVDNESTYSTNIPNADGNGLSLEDIPEVDKVKEDYKDKCDERNDEFNISSLFSVKRRLKLSGGVSQQVTKLPSKRTKLSFRGRPLVANDHIFPLDPPFVCPYEGCNRDCDTRPKLKKHYRNHDEKRHACGFCEKKFLYRKDLAVHCRTHTGEKPYQCSDCGARFSQKSTLKNHLPIHSGKTAEFSCAGCDRTYSSARSLSLHVKEKHLQKQTIHNCRECGKTYETRSAYLAHVRTECNGSCFLCAKCGRKYRRKEPYELHIEKCEGVLEYKCEMCGNVFKKKRNLMNHVFSLHSTPPPGKTDIVAVAVSAAGEMIDPEHSEVTDGREEEILSLENMIFLD